MEARRVVRKECWWIAWDGSGEMMVVAARGRSAGNEDGVWGSEIIRTSIEFWLASWAEQMDRRGGFSVSSYSIINCPRDC